MKTEKGNGGGDGAILNISKSNHLNHSCMLHSQTRGRHQNLYRAGKEFPCRLKEPVEYYDITPYLEKEKNTYCFHTSNHRKENFTISWLVEMPGDRLRVSLTREDASESVCMCLCVRERQTD